MTAAYAFVIMASSDSLLIASGRRGMITSVELTRVDEHDETRKIGNESAAMIARRKETKRQEDFA